MRTRSENAHIWSTLRSCWMRARARVFRGMRAEHAHCGVASQCFGNCNVRTSIGAKRLSCMHEACMHEELWRAHVHTRWVHCRVECKDHWIIRVSREYTAELYYDRISYGHTYESWSSFWLFLVFMARRLGGRRRVTPHANQNRNDACGIVPTCNCHDAAVQHLDYASYIAKSL